MTSRSPLSALRSPLAPLAGVALLSLASVDAQTPILVPPNTNGRPGLWLPAQDHAAHVTACTSQLPWYPAPRFYPIHASLIPKGDYAGCVLMWELGGFLGCRYSNTVLDPLGADIDVRYAIFDPRTSPPTIHKFVWRVGVLDVPLPGCGASPTGHQGLFCGGHCWLPDGRLLVAGGDYWGDQYCTTGHYQNHPPTYAGSKIVMVFDPDLIDVNVPLQPNNGPAPGKPWTSLHNPPAGQQQPLDLQVARWYPTATLMAPANLSALGNPFVYISVAGGVETYNANAVTLVPPGDPGYATHELLRWNINTGVITRDLRIGQTSGVAGLFDGPTTPAVGGLSFVYYPRTHFVSARTGSPDGRLWMSGMAAQAADADVINAPEVWTNGPAMPIGTSDTMLEEATTVLFPPITPAYRDLQFVIGGSKTTNVLPHTGTVTNECWMMQTRTVPSAWLGPALPMHHARKFPNAVILPDASILVVGGGTGIGHGTPGGGQLEPELFVNGVWHRMSNQATERTYHSIALLLADGRVLSAGGDSCHDSAEYEIFVPPYLHPSAVRPSFVQAPPSVIHYGQQFSFLASLPFGQGLDRVVLMRPGSVTHGQDPGQRYEPLVVLPSNEDSTTTTVVAPTNPTILPPGYGMLFLLSGGTPSAAHWVQLLP